MLPFQAALAALSAGRLVYRPLADAWAVYDNSGLRPTLVEKGP